MIEKRTTLNQTEILADGTIQARFAIDLIEDGKVIDRKWHRTSFPPGHDVDAQMAAVNLHLAAMGKEPVADPQPIKDHAAVAWTREKVEAHRERVSAEIADGADRAKYRAAMLSAGALGRFPAK